MRFEFDPAKDAVNVAKHGLLFESFTGFDTEPVIVVDDRIQYGEERFLAFGRIAGLGQCVVFTLRDGVARLISFRRAHEKEMRRYE